MTLGELRRKISERLRAVEGDQSSSMARMLVCDALDMTQTQMMMRDNDSASQEDQQRLMSMCDRLARREPLQYVTGKAYFRGNQYYVDSNVLIPRPETEVLVDNVVDVVRDGDRVVDIGTGSGCIAISIKQDRPHSQVSAIDISETAIQVARRNAEAMQVDVSFVRADIMSDWSGDKPYDIIVSNPPYVCDREKAEMERNVLDYEPHIALFVPDDDPLKFYRAIATKGMRGMLATGGHVMFEINEAYADEMSRMMRELGYVDVDIVDDQYGKPRVCRGRRPK